MTEIISSIFDSLGDGMSLAYTYLDDVLYVRIYDGERYVFPLPFLLSDSGDLKTACIKLSVYTRRELIPLIITDVPREELSLITEIFPHVDAACYEDDDDSFFIVVKNECDLLEDMPCFTLGDVTLDAITENDVEHYADLCRDAALNKYWGYDVSTDNPSGASDYYFSVAKREFYDGVAVTLAIRYLGEFVGEAVIYDFDYLGSAEIAVRILPGFHGKGVGSLATETLIKLAGKIGLSSLRAEIINENSASIKMTSKFMNLKSVGDCKTTFTLDL